MPKVTDFELSGEVPDIVEQILDTFPSVFPGFDVNSIGVVHTKGKSSKGSNPIRLIPVGYPRDVWVNKVYIMDVNDSFWQDLDQKRKNLSVFHVMCAIPEGGFDPESKEYGKKKKPDYQLFAEEFAVTGGIPNWIENEDVRDVFEAADDDGDIRVPVTAEAIASVGE